MKGFNWTRMDSTPEGRLIKSERTKGRAELIAAFAIQAGSDMGEHDRFGELRRDIEQRHTEILPENDSAEAVIEEIIQKHEKTLRNDKGLDDKEEQIAYIIALVREIQDRKDRMH